MIDHSDDNLATFVIEGFNTPSQKVVAVEVEIASALNGRIKLVEKNNEVVLVVHGEDFYRQYNRSDMRQALHNPHRFGDLMVPSYKDACVELSQQQWKPNGIYN